MRRYGFLKVFAAILLILTLIIPAGTEVQAATYKKGIYKVDTTSDPLKVRTCPGSDYMKVGELSKGTKVNVTFVSSNGWGKIVYKNLHGWICLQYCKYVGPSEEPDGEQSRAVKDSDVVFGISADSLKWVTGWKQEFSRSSGLCTSSASTTLLRRRQAAEGKEVTFTFSDIRAAMGGDPVPDSNGKYGSCSSYFSSTTPFKHLYDEKGKKIKNPSDDVYYLIKETEVTLSHNREYIADLLDVHPEGVVVYSRYPGSGRGMHAILLSDYERHKDGSLQFYAYDPANGTGRRKLEDTWMLTKERSVGMLFDNMISIWYVKGELAVDDNRFDHPEAEACKRTVTVTKKKAYTYSEPSEDSEQNEKLAKGDTVKVSYTVSDDNGQKWYITKDDTYIKADCVEIK